MATAHARFRARYPEALFTALAAVASKHIFQPLAFRLGHVG